ncbi:MAG: lipoyl(octanoyl) transferase LipB [Holosporales bacterium]|nr:lipoyl(octanoyl) transferase LipB [Holosporales bacterium]
MRFIEQDLTEYCLSLIDMEISVESVQGGADEVVFITEHPEVYTAGRSFEPSDFLGKKSNEGRVYYPNRGGRVTIHSPGQIVIYPIINLGKRGIGVIEYVRELEAWIIRILEKFGVRSFKSAEGIGVWAGPLPKPSEAELSERSINESGKIGYVGVRISKGISSHGFCINISNDLDLFRWIVPCGLVDARITSLFKIIDRNIPIKTVSKAVIETCRF